MNTTKEEKEELRSRMLALRKQLNPKEKRRLDHDICERLKRIIIRKDAQVVHAYLPIKGEVDITPFINWLLKKGVQVICPKVLPKRQLENLVFTGFDNIEVGEFQTIHPSGNHLYDGPIDVIVMPGLAFDKELNRLGYGGGYYDRFLLKHLDSLKVAVQYGFQVHETIPIEDHDVKVDTLLN
ncbi:MAG: 5-formyltetrahydrofolate cyclo-ligase [Flavobacteriales bacterium]|nr:5-formyltetrahydrofolate cyclo-ligase [Flavobacteriales bacterium]